MSLNPSQRRTVIIRGRSQTDMDTLLPIFANLVERNTPLPALAFDQAMIGSISKIFVGKSTKTYRNYLTETIGQLFSMYYLENNQVEISDLALKLINDGDQPAFFKVLVSRMQFPNPSSKKHKYDAEVAEGLGVKHLVLVLDVLRVAHNHGEKITIDELAYYVLNSRDALRGNYDGASLFQVISRARVSKITPPVFKGSYEKQHITESMKLLSLANLVRTDSLSYWVNQFEMNAINAICKHSPNSHLFRLRMSSESHKNFQQLWKKYLTDTSQPIVATFATQVSSLGLTAPQRLVPGKPKRTSADTGREGELLVLDLENLEIDFVFPGKGWSAQDYTAKRGIGFDIESIFHDDPKLNGRPHRIEVKSTIRSTKPDLLNSPAPDGFTLTRSEKKAVDAYGESFSIYRVYIYSGGYVIQKLRNPSQLFSKGLLDLIPDTWSANYVASQLPAHCQIIENSI